MKWLLDKTEEHLEKGLAYQAKGDLENARFHYLKASEYLFKAAQQSEGKMREKRLELAERLLERAKIITRLLERDKPRKRALEPVPVTEDKAASWLVVERPKVTFSDVAGLEDVKEQIRLKLIYPYTPSGTR